jgi:DNA primase
LKHAEPASHARGVAGLISPATLDRIRAASDIVEVIGGYLRLKRAGSNFVALCPFHQEKTPSFNVNPRRQIFHCFGCHKGGDVFRFVQEYEGVSFIEAVRRLADRAGIVLEFDQAPGAQQARQLKETLLALHEQICRHWQEVLADPTAGQPARQYLARRAVPDEAVKLFRLGYAPEAWDDTVNWARAKGYDLALVEEAGLIIRKPESNRYYDRFRGRLIFPICDEQGRVIGFSGRILTEADNVAKYLNSPETPIFTKGKVFFGLDKAKRALLDAGFAVVCEGQLDLIACYMAGIHNVVAPQGTAFTPDHARILKRYVDEVVLCFDSDAAGQKAAARVLDSLLTSGLAIRVATVPAPHDPDSFIKAHGGPAFQQLIQQARGFFDWYLDWLCATHQPTTDKGRLAVLTGMAEAVLKTGNAVLVDTYAQKTALRLGVSPEAVRAEFRKAAAAPAQLTQPGPAEAPTQPACPPPPERELWLMRFLLLDEAPVGWVAQHLDLDWVQHPVVRAVVAARLTAHQQQNWRGVPALLDEFQDPAARQLVTAAAMAALPTENLVQQVVMAVQALRDDWIERQLASLTQQLAQPNLTDEQLMQVERRKAQLRTLKQQPLPVPVQRPGQA